MEPLKVRMWMKSKDLESVQSASASSTRNLQFGGTHEGCMGLRSVPTTSDSGYSSAKSTAQMPVPVPMSSALCNLFSGIGALKSLPKLYRVSGRDALQSDEDHLRRAPLSTRVEMWWKRSRRSCSFSSFGRK